MLDHVLAVSRAATSIRHIIVVSPERDTVPEDIPVLADAGRGLNEALSAARDALLGFGARELLILPADLPLLLTQDIDALVAAGRMAGFALAPDAAGVGTNGIYLNAARGFRFQFGPGSLQRHLDAASRCGWTAATVSRPGLAFDVDSPMDLERFDHSWREVPCQA